MSNEFTDFADETATITFAEFSEAILHGWDSCIPFYHIDAREAWRWLFAAEEQCERALTAEGLCAAHAGNVDVVKYWED